jgi:hypothetical protein
MDNPEKLGTQDEEKNKKKELDTTICKQTHKCK